MVGEYLYINKERYAVHLLCINIAFMSMQRTFVVEQTLKEDRASKNTCVHDAYDIWRRFVMGVMD